VRIATCPGVHTKMTPRKCMLILNPIPAIFTMSWMTTFTKRLRTSIIASCCKITPLWPMMARYHIMQVPTSLPCCYMVLIYSACRTEEQAVCKLRINF
jgi:hypothetical protein